MMSRFSSIVGFFFFLLFGVQLHGQAYTTVESAPSKVLKLYEKANEAHRKGDFETGLKYIEKALDAKPDFIDAHIQKAALAYGLKDQTKTISALEQAVSIDSTYEPGILQSLARLYADDFKFLRAEKLLRKFLNIPGLKIQNRRELELELASYPWRAEAMAHPVDYSPEPIGPPINTDADEALPAFSVDGNTMVFTRRSHGQEDLYTSTKGSRGWNEPVPLSLNTARNEGAHAISTDGNILIFTGCNQPDGMGSCDLYIAFLRDGRWTSPVNMGPPVNTPGWEGQPSLSPDGKRLYFSSNRPGGYGGRDIYVAERIPGGTWYPPEPLDSTINSPGNEESPFIHFDGRSLYFMSNGHVGMGDYDLFLSKAGSSGWSDPVNLGYPINTPGREGALTVHPDGVHAYYTSDNLDLVDSRLRMNTNILRFVLPPHLRPDPITYVKGSVRDRNTNQPVRADVVAYPLDGDSSLLAVKALPGKDGAFTLCLANGYDYGLHVLADGYVFHSDRFALADSGTYSARKLDVRLVPVTPPSEGEAPGEPVVLHNIYFEINSSELLPRSFPELQTLLSLLQTHPSIKLEIRGHTDNTGSPESNLQLSQDRADAVRAWLLSQGVEAERIVAKGFGETKPVADNETAEGRQQNRRTEFMVLDKSAK